ncbi:MAG: AAA domain-containing protein, partial [Acidimicrobiia bacterium]
MTGVPAFSITPRVVIGTFAYTKLPMVKDLQNHVESLAEHDLISAIAGVEEAQGSLRELRATDLDPRLPDLLAPADEHLILDADASQNHAINAALGGEPLIIQGPPGTGKSQTIANLITSMAAQGKRVLFVAEKRAAIDAVTKRLRHAGLGDLVLDLHGGVTSKKQLAAELGQTLAAMAQIARVDHCDLHRRLTQERTSLDNYARAMHEVREPWGLTIFEVHQGLIALGNDYGSDLRFVGSRLNDLNAVTVSRVRAELTEWAGLTAPINSGLSPWSGAEVHTEDGARQALDLVSDLNSVLPQVSSQLDAVLGATGLAVPESVEAWTEVLGLLQGVESTLQSVKPGIYELDLGSLAAALEPARHGFFPRLTAQVFKADFRAAKKVVGSLASTGKMSAVDACRIANEARRHSSEWSRHGGQGLPRLPGGLETVTAGFDQLTQQLASLGAFLVTRDLRKHPHRTIREETTRLLTDQQTLFRLPRIHQLEQSLQAAHVGPLLDGIRSGAPPDGLVGRFDHAWLSSIRTAITSSDPRLANFDANLHSQLVDGFRADDQEHLEITALRVRRAVAERAVAVRNQYPTQETLVKAQSQRKRGHLPLRRLFEQAPDVLTALRPCWVMSPLVVAQTMPARTVFDVVIFDEASQVLPADAISALLRAPQAIVAGDQHQLPPTTFFEGGGDDSGVEDDDGTGLTSGFESVLDVLNALLRNYMLTWHYRSEDERLIAFSNHSIYHGGLTTFPGSIGQERLRHVLVPHRVEASADTRSNNDEVVRVVDLMVEHARTRPTETLGVIAMGIHHADRVEEMLRRR